MSPLLCSQQACTKSTAAAAEPSGHPICQKPGLGVQLRPGLWRRRELPPALVDAGDQSSFIEIVESSGRGVAGCSPSFKSKHAVNQMADKFLFVDSSPAGRASADKRLSDARSFVMRRVRAQQKAAPKEWKFVHHGQEPATGRAVAASRSQSDHAKELLGGAASRPGSALTDVLPFRSAGRTPVRLSDPASGPYGESVSAVSRKRKRAPCDCNARQSKDGVRTLCAVCAATAAKELVPSPSTSVEGVLDPFDSVAVPLSTRTKGLVAYFMNGITPVLTPMVKRKNTQIHRGWLAPSFGHPAFMHSILCLTALQYSLRNPGRPPYEVMHHRIQAVRAVKQNLLDPNEALRDENIAAVFNLLCVEDTMAVSAVYGVGRLQADTQQRLVHFNGLRRMIKSKGGIRALGQLKGLQSFLIRHTAVQAIASFEISYTLPKGLLRDLYDYPNCSRFISGPAPVTTLCRQHGLDHEFVELIRSVECLVRDLTEWYADPTKYSWDVFDIQNLPCIVIDQTLRWYLENQSTLRPIEGILFITIGICLAFICRGPNVVYSPLPIGVTRLLGHFAQPDVLQPFKGTGLDLWIAVLCVGGTDFSGSEDFFFAVYTRILEESYPHLESFADFSAILHGLIWLPLSLDQFAVDIWSRTHRSVEVVNDGVPGSARTKVRFGLGRTGRRTVNETETLRNPYVNAHPYVHLSVLGSAYEL